MPKCIIDNYNIIINKKPRYGQPVDSNIKRYEEIRKLTGQGEEYTPGCLLGYEYIKNRFKLIPVDLGWEKELNGYQQSRKVIQEIEFLEELN